MIHTIEIENFRGIRTGRLEGLAPLTILTGPNASGKSAVLDALLVGASPDPADAVGRAVARHPTSPSGARWLFFQLAKTCSISLGLDSGVFFGRSLQWSEQLPKGLEERMITGRYYAPFVLVRISNGSHFDGDDLIGNTVLDTENRYVPDRTENGFDAGPPVDLIDPGLPVSLHRTFSAVSKAGRIDALNKLLTFLVDDFERLEILVDDRDRPLLHINRSREGAVPLSLSGDGVQSFVQLALELTAAPEGLALIEEPEVYQHPKALWQTAKVILANVRRGVQVVMTTHSLELIDALISEATEEDLDRMVTFNLALEDGDLQTERWTGDDFAFARREVGTDLR